MTTTAADEQLAQAMFRRAYAFWRKMHSEGKCPGEADHVVAEAATLLVEVMPRARGNTELTRGAPVSRSSQNFLRLSGY